MKSSLRILLIGAADPMHVAYDIFLRQHQCELATAADYREIYGLPTEKKWEVAVLYHSLSQNEMRESAHFIRRRWPEARILIMRSETPCMDDALYDDRVVPGINPEILLAVVDRLAGSRERKLTA
jgi:hypothetical protein